jgi:hypothetical protein
MHVTISEPEHPPPVDRGYVVSIVIARFKGHRDVEVHLYRPQWSSEEGSGYDWERLLGGPIRRDRPVDPEGSRKVLLESFSAQERDLVVKFLQERYADRLQSLSASAMPFPIPMGLVPLSEIPEEGTIGRIRFERYPGYTLEFAVHGIFDLARHERLDEWQPAEGDTR